MKTLAQPHGTFAIRQVEIPLIRRIPSRPLKLHEIIHYGFPGDHVSKEVAAWRRRNFKHIWRGLWRVNAARMFRLPHTYGQWALAVISPTGERTDYGLASMRVVTTVGAKFIVDAMKGLVSISSMRYHGLGSGGGLESIADEGLTTELSSEYNPADTRGIGTLTNGTDDDGDNTGPILDNVFRSIATIALAGSASIREAGIFSQSSRTGGVPDGGYLLDRGVFTDTTILEGYAVESQYDFTVTPGS